MKPFREYITEDTVTWQKMPNNRKLAFLGGDLVGTIEFEKGTPDLIPGSKDKYTVMIRGSYRDSKLKIDRVKFRKLGVFDTDAEATKALSVAAAKLPRP